MSDDHFDSEHSFASPDGRMADPDGRLFIRTDGNQRDKANNQLLVADTNTGEVRRLLSGVGGCEVTGITNTPDRRTLFVNLQHPGNGGGNADHRMADKPLRMAQCHAERRSRVRYRDSFVRPG